MKKVIFLILFYSAATASYCQHLETSFNLKFWVGDSLLSNKDIYLGIGNSDTSKVELIMQENKVILSTEDSTANIYFGVWIRNTFYDFIGGIPFFALQKEREISMGITNLKCSSFLSKNSSSISSSPYRYFVALDSIVYEQPLYKITFKQLPRKLKLRLKKCSR